VRANPVKEKLRRGELAIGTMVFEFASPGLPAILGTTGADFAIYDMEHTGLSLESLRSLMSWSRGAGPTPLTRVPAIDPQFIAHALDVGALGVMVPNVETVEQARLVVEAMKYPPVGRRGAAFGFAHDDFERAADVGAHVAALNERSLLIAQIESQRGLDNVDEIARVEGIDVLWVGHFDLTLSMGIPGQFQERRFLEAMERVAAAVETLRAQAAHLGEQARADALEIGFLVARTLLEAEVRQSPQAVFGLVRQAVRRAGDSRRISVRLSPDDAAIVNAENARAPLFGPAAARVEVVADPALARGDCVVDTDFGRVDGRLETRLDELRRAIEIDHDAEEGAA
jgi:2-dehydro-3-deoxyglucarate aldolase/4-hydroxy-2-oxoheptanedioate aldolase